MERQTRNETVPELPEERDEKELAALSYLWLFSLIILVAKRSNPFIQHHARRATILFLLSLVVWFVPYIQYGEFVILALCVFGFVQASMGNENHTPVLSELADGTLSRRDVRHYFKEAEDEAIKAVKPDYVAPAERAEAPQAIPEDSAMPREGAVELDEEKMSALFHRLTEDENELHRLEDEVKKVEEEVESMKK
jgi:uncharacterized membrane protein